MGRSPCCDKQGLKKGPWTPEEDQKLLAYIDEHGHGNWRALPTKAGLQRCGKSCRLRWTNYLRPDIKRGKFSLQEEQTIIQLHALLGNRWSAIATHLPKRTDNEIKNYWNTHLKKRLTKMGIDPVTHKPKNDALVSAADGGGGSSSSVPQSKNAANLSHMAQWESARLEAEARLVRQSKLRPSSNNNNSSFGSPLSPDIHINNDHHQIVPSVSPTHHSNHYLSMTTTAAAAASASSTAPRCLDVLKAWHREWPSTSTGTGTSTSANNNNNNNNNEGILGIGMGLTGLNGGVVLGIESPTSTLSFSENAQPPVVPTMGTGAVIEFMGHQEDQHHHHQEMVKEEGNHHHHHHHQHYNNDPHHDVEWERGYNNHHNNEIEINNTTLSFSPSSAAFHEVNNADKDDNNNNNNDNDNHDHGHQGFMEGFTELLLSTKTSDHHQKAVEEEEEEEEEEGGNNDTNHQNNNNKNNNNKAGSTSRNNESDYFEDNKTYWNSILNLVNSSPSHSPIF